MLNPTKNHSYNSHWISLNPSKVDSDFARPNHRNARGLSGQLCHCVPGIWHCCRWNMGRSNSINMSISHIRHIQTFRNMPWLTSKQIWSPDLSQAFTSSHIWIILTHRMAISACDWIGLHSLLGFAEETFKALRSSHGPGYPAPNKIKKLTIYICFGWY